MSIQVGSRVKTPEGSKAGTSMAVDQSKGTVQAVTPAVTRRFGGVLQTFDEADVLFDGALIPVRHIVVGLSQ